MSYKIAFFDMDGTLYQTENDIILTTSITAIDTLREKGFTICAATGRPLNQMDLIEQHIDFDYMVLINGGYVVDSNKKLLFENPIRNQTVEDIINWCEEGSQALMFHFGDCTMIYQNFYKLYHFCDHAHVLNKLYYDESRSYHQHHHAYNAVVEIKDTSILQEFLKKHPDLRCDSIGQGLYDIFPAENDKSIGIDYLLKKLTLSWEDCIAFGDSTNDIQMLKKAGCGVAMGNASDYVKSFADITTDTVYDDGIYNALFKDILI